MHRKIAKSSSLKALKSERREKKTAFICGSKPRAVRKKYTYTSEKNGNKKRKMSTAVYFLRIVEFFHSTNRLSPERFLSLATTVSALFRGILYSFFRIFSWVILPFSAAGEWSRMVCLCVYVSRQWEYLSNVYNHSLLDRFPVFLWTEENFYMRLFSCPDFFFIYYPFE